MDTYKLLSKLFYENPEEYNKTLQLRLANEEIVKLPISIKGNIAFYTPTVKMFNKIEKVFKNKSVIDKMESNLPPIAINFLLAKSLKDEIILTNEIEGVSSTRKEIETAIINQNTSKKARFKGLAAKYIKLINDDKIIVESCEQVRQLYDDIVLDEIDNLNKPDGKIFRKEQVAVVTATQKEKHRGIMPEQKIIDYMEKSLGFLKNNDSNQITKIAIFHYLFGYIHPFYDGNGRLSRFISSCLLKDELGILSSLRLSYTIKNNIKDYYDAFDICNDEKNKGELTYFILMFLDLLLEGTQDLIKKLKELTDKFNYYNEILENNYNMDNSEGCLIFVLYQNALFGDSFLTIDELKKILHVSSTTIRKGITDISATMILNTEKIGKKIGYSLDLESIEKLKKK